MKKNKIWNIIIYLSKVLPVVYLLFFLICENSFARVGGGENFSSGSEGGFSGHSSGSGGFGFIIYLLLQLCIRYPYIGIPAVLIALFFFYKSGNFANKYNQGRVINKSYQTQNQSEKQNAIDKLFKHDPNFNEQTLIDRIKKAFLKLQTAWCKQDMLSVVHFISDGVFERFSLQIKMQKDFGFKDHMEDIQITDCQIVQLQSDDIFDSITFKISAYAIDYKVDLKTDKIISGSKSPEPFTEYWSFVRRPGKNNITKNGLMEGNCPNCGALLSINEISKCGSCNALIRSGQYDWVLTEITQESEWQLKSNDQIPGITKMKYIDAGFSVYHLEDLVSVMFWRTIASYQQGKIDPIKKLASNDFCKLFTNELIPDKNGVRIAYKDCAIGSVETIGVGANIKNNWDYALVRVRSCANRIQINEQTKETSILGTQISTLIYILKRKNGVKSNIDLALSSAHCPNCGAPISDSTANSCKYCNTVLNDGTSSWILDGTEIDLSARVQSLKTKINQNAEINYSSNQLNNQLTSNLQTDKMTSGLAALSWMVHVMYADNKIGPIDSDEMQYIKEYANARKISNKQLEMITTAAQNQTLEIPLHTSKDEAYLWMKDMVLVALSDGNISNQEKNALSKFGKKLDYQAADINLLISKARKEKYKKAKQSLKKGF